MAFQGETSLTNQEYLKNQQYNGPTNLNARAFLHERFSTNPVGFHTWVFDLLDLPAQGRVLEIGCGAGAFWLNNLKPIPEGCIITLADLSLGMAEEARHKLASSQYTFAFAVADAQTLPFLDNSFDVVIANHMLYHVPNISIALSEIQRVLRPTGRFYAATNGEGHMLELNEMAHRFSPQAPLLGASFANTFTLENGGPQLLRYFSDVALHRYEDSLIVTEAAPLVAYARSTAISAYFDEEAFTEFVKAEIEENRVIYVTKATGLFEARKPIVPSSTIDPIADSLRDELIEQGQTLETASRLVREQREVL